MTIEEIKEKVKTVNKEITAVNLFVIVLGLVLVIFPTTAIELVCRGIGIALGIWGILRIIEYIRLRKIEVFGSFCLAQGCALLALGIFIGVRPMVLSGILTTILALILFVGAVMKLQYMVEFMQAHSSGWLAQIIGTLLMIAACVVALINPFGATRLLVVFLGIALIINGLWDVLTMLYISRFMKKTNKESKMAKKRKNKKFVEVSYKDEEDTEG